MASLEDELLQPHPAWMGWAVECFHCVLGSSLPQDTLSDIILVSKEGQLINCHTLFLGVNEVFRSSIRIKQQETNKLNSGAAAAGPSSSYISTTTTNIGDKLLVNMNTVRYEVLIELLRFLYLGKVSNFSSDPTMAEELLDVAEQYLDRNLKLICVNEIKRSLSMENMPQFIVLADQYQFLDSNSLRMIDRFLKPENVCSILLLAYERKIEPLCNKCYSLINKNKAVAMASEQWPEISANVNLLLKLFENSATDDDVSGGSGAGGGGGDRRPQRGNAESLRRHLLLIRGRGRRYLDAADSRDTISARGRRGFGDIDSESAGLGLVKRCMLCGERGHVTNACRYSDRFGFVFSSRRFERNPFIRAPSGDDSPGGGGVRGFGRVPQLPNNPFLSRFGGGFGDRGLDCSCYKCGLEGHMPRDCQYPHFPIAFGGRENDDGIVAASDGGFGSTNSNRSTAGGFGSSANAVGGFGSRSDHRGRCYKCGVVGHLPKDCPIIQPPNHAGGFPSDAAASGGGFGLSASAANNSGGFGASLEDNQVVLACLSCGEEGHLANWCPNTSANHNDDSGNSLNDLSVNPWESSDSDGVVSGRTRHSQRSVPFVSRCLTSNDVVCAECGKPGGHFSADCPNSENFGVINYDDNDHNNDGGDANEARNDDDDGGDGNAEVEVVEGGGGGGDEEEEFWD